MESKQEASKKPLKLVLSVSRPKRTKTTSVLEDCSQVALAINARERKRERKWWWL